MQPCLVMETMATEPSIQEPDTLSRTRLDYSLDLDRLSPVFSNTKLDQPSGQVQYLKPHSKTSGFEFAGKRNTSFSPQILNL